MCVARFSPCFCHCSYCPIVLLQSTLAMSARTPTLMPSHQASAASASRAINGNPSPASTTIGPSTSACKPGSAMKRLASSTASREGCASANTGVFPPPASAYSTAFATSASESGSVTPAAAAHGVQQEAAVAATSAGSAAIASVPSRCVHPAQAGIVGCMQSTGSYRTAGSQNLISGSVPSAGKYAQVIWGS